MMMTLLMVVMETTMMMDADDDDDDESDYDPGFELDVWHMTHNPTERNLCIIHLHSS